MSLLAIDIGSSSVKAALLSGSRVGTVARVPFSTHHKRIHGSLWTAIRLKDIEQAVREAIARLGDAAGRVEAIVHATMAPSWLAMDAAGRALTSVVTHQDRRATVDAQDIESCIGQKRHLRLAGNRPFPGGISSTTYAWHLRQTPDVMRRADLVGHLGTWLVRALTGARVMDRSNAGFTGLMNIRTGGWSDELIAAAGGSRSHLPRIVDSDEVVGAVTRVAARRFGLTEGTPLLAGCIDGSAAMLAAGARIGQLVNVCGSTDVLALCLREPHPREHLLTRPLGVDGKWVCVDTIAASGSAVEWLRQTCFREMDVDAFHALARRVARRRRGEWYFISPDLAGSRTSMTAGGGGISRLGLDTAREHILQALLQQLARRRERGLELLRELDAPVRRDVFVTGGGGSMMRSLMRRGWPSGFRFRTAGEATLRGLAGLVR